jgi:hypothetical protein
MQQPWRSDKHSHITAFQVLTATKTIIYGNFPFRAFIRALYSNYIVLALGLIFA